MVVKVMCEEKCSGANKGNGEEIISVSTVAMSRETFLAKCHYSCIMELRLIKTTCIGEQFVLISVYYVTKF